MGVTVKIPTQLRAAAGGESEAQLEGATVREVLDSLYERYDGLSERLADESGSLQALCERVPERRGHSFPRRAGHSGR